MVERQDPRGNDPGPPAGDPVGHGLHADALGAAGPVGGDDGSDFGTRPRQTVTNQHSFADEEFEVDSAQNYHGAVDPV